MSDKQKEMVFVGKQNSKRRKGNIDLRNCKIKQKEIFTVAGEKQNRNVSMCAKSVSFAVNLRLNLVVKEYFREKEERSLRDQRRRCFYLLFVKPVSIFERQAHNDTKKKMQNHDLWIRNRSKKRRMF